MGENRYDKRRYARPSSRRMVLVAKFGTLIHLYPLIRIQYTYIMEPSISLHDHIFSRLDEVALRKLPPTQNPLGIPDISYTNYSKPIDILISQDCSGFNLGSFLIRKTEFTKRVLDMWWDPVLYEQKLAPVLDQTNQRHMEWAHKEQDAFEHLYTNQPYIRSGVGFLPQRFINAFPRGACDGFESRDDIFYNERDRDFIVNMAGCEYVSVFDLSDLRFGRNCLEEMMHFRKLAGVLNNRRWWKPWTWFQ
jgi:mannan polymerase II complex MNN10 subunit